MTSSLRGTSRILFLVCIGFGMLSCVTSAKVDIEPGLGLSGEAENETFSEYMAGETEAEQREAQPLTREERNFIHEYVDMMTYVIDYNENTPEDPELMRQGVDNAITVLEQEPANLISVNRAAGNILADVYIELNAVTAAEYKEGKYWGQADIILTVFDASTGSPLGQVPYSSLKTFSSSSDFDARSKALLSSIYRAMPMARNQAAVYMEKVLERGVGYTLHILNTPDTGMLREFRRTLGKRVRSLNTVSAGPEKTVFQVNLFGYREDLEKLVYAVAETIPGFERMEMVFFQGKSITFNTGL